MISYKDYRYNKIVRYLDSMKHGLRKFPASLQIALTDHCFNKCITCGHWKRKKKDSLDLTNLINFLMLGKHMGLESVCYSGGDPFIYKDINHLLKWHHKSGLKFGFITAGYIPPQVDMQLAAEADWIRISLDSITKYKECRGGSISFQDVNQSIKTLQDYGANLGLGITIHQHNKDELVELFEYALFKDIKEVRCWISRHTPELEFDTNSIVQIITQYAFRFESAKISNNLTTILETIEKGTEIVSFPSCKACLLQLFIGANGGIYPCCILAGDTENQYKVAPLGNLHQGSWEEIYKNILIFSEKFWSELPETCKKGCIPRLSSINTFANEHWKDYNFI